MGFRLMVKCWPINLSVLPMMPSIHFSPRQAGIYEPYLGRTRSNVGRYELESGPVTGRADGSREKVEANMFQEQFLSIWNQLLLTKFEPVNTENYFIQNSWSLVKKMRQIIMREAIIPSERFVIDKISSTVKFTVWICNYKQSCLGNHRSCSRPCP